MKYSEYNKSYSRRNCESLKIDPRLLRVNIQGENFDVGQEK